MSGLEYLKAKTDLALADLERINQAIDDIPARLEKAIAQIPAQLDEKLKDKISDIIEVAELAEKNAQEALQTQSKDFSVIADSIKTDNLAAFKLSLDSSIKPVIKQLEEAAVSVSKISKEKKGSPAPMIITSVLCAFLSLAGGFAGTAIWNKTFLDSAQNQLEQKSRALTASIKGKDAILSTLPASQAKKANEIWLDTANKELKNDK
ncbi:hypothetical protein ABVL22_004278 [Salmonella enterica]